MSQIGEYTVLPITIPKTPAYPKSATHTIYLRPHTPKVPTASSSRSLFLVNVPADSTEAHLRAVFVSLIGTGRFESANFEHEKASIPITELAMVPQKSTNKKRKRGEETTQQVEPLPSTWDRECRRSGSTAVVVLADEKCIEGALKAIKKLHSKKEKKKDVAWPIWGEGIQILTGSQRYLTHHKLRYPDTHVLQRNVDLFMDNFNKLEEEKAREAKRVRSVPDEDGFVTVTRGGRTGPARSEQAEAKREEMEAKEKKRKEEMGDFYRFQMRERRKEEQGALVKRFEEDRKRVGAMREERRGRFRPEK